MPETTTTAARWEQYSEAGRALLSQGDHARAIEAFAAAARAAERDFGADSLQAASALSSLGQIHYQFRKLQTRTPKVANPSERRVLTEDKSLGVRR